MLLWLPGRHGSHAVADMLLTAFASLPEDAKKQALSTLVSRKSFANLLVDAMQSGTIAPESVPAFIIRQAVALEDPQLNERLEKVWGKINISRKEVAQQYAKYRKILRPAAIASADASRGRALYEANCGNCHRLFGSGGQIGPDITGANRTSTEYWLENILQPNALIGKAYQVTNVLTADGRVISGIVTEENDQAFTLQTATEKIVVSKDDIEQTQQADVSLMPVGQLETFSQQQVRDLFKYLMGKEQVPLPSS